MSRTVGFFASFEKAQMPFPHRQTKTMKKDVATILAENLNRLMDSRPPRPSQKAIAQRAGLDQKTVSRILNMSVATSVSAVQGLAAIWELEPWQLLFPDLDPKNPPVVSMSQSERDAYELIRTAALKIAAEPLPKYEK